MSPSWFISLSLVVKKILTLVNKKYVLFNQNPHPNETVKNPKCWQSCAKIFSQIRQCQTQQGFYTSVWHLQILQITWGCPGVGQGRRAGNILLLMIKNKHSSLWNLALWNLWSSTDLSSTTCPRWGNITWYHIPEDYLYYTLMLELLSYPRLRTVVFWPSKGSWLLFKQILF
jgi:hypothetical protein